MRRPVLLRFSAVLLGAALWLRPHLSACASCFGNPDSPLTKGMAMGIFSLLAVTVGVLGGIAAFAWRIGRRSGAGDGDPHSQGD